MEESRTNLCLQSQTFQTTWTANPTQLNTTGLPAYIDVATAPDGTATADKLIATTLSGTHQFRQSITVVSGTTYTISNYFKAAEVNFASIAIFGTPSSSADWIALFNISTASPATGAFNGFSSTAIVNAGNGWFRCSTTFTATASGSLSVRIGGASGVIVGNHSYSGDNSSGFFIWGAQVEAGAFPTSYIPTTTASVVRSTDVCSITGANFTGMYNEFAGTLLCESTLKGVSLSVTPNTAIFGNQQNGISLIESTGAGSLNGNITSDENTTFNSFTGNVSSGVARKSAMAFQNEGSAILCLNGTLGTQGDSVVLPIDATGGQTPSSLYLFGGQFSTVKSFRYYKKRLANAKLQTLTT
jgi:hypothetical protein